MHWLAFSVLSPRSYLGIVLMLVYALVSIFSVIEYEIIGEGSRISTNQKPGNSAFSLLIG